MYLLLLHFCTIYRTVSNSDELRNNILKQALNSQHMWQNKQHPKHFAAFVQFKKRQFLQNKRLFTVNIIVKEGNTLGGCFLDRLDRFYGRIFLHCHRTTSHLSKDRNYLPYLIHGYMTLGGRMTLEWPPFMYSDIFLVIFAGNFRQQRPQKSL